MRKVAAARPGSFPGISIDVSVAAGNWGGTRRLKTLARRAAEAALAETGAAQDSDSEISLVFTDDEAMRALNARWRDKDKPTNVLSFPAYPLKPGEPLPPMLGDIVLAAGTVAGEAALADKPIDHHIIHLIVHGILHLLGHDHEDEAQAGAMEELERRALARLAIPDPYA